MSSSTATHISAPTPTPNQPASSIVLTSGSHIHIRAPAHAVFSTILDAETYPSWSRWCPSLTFPPNQSLRVPASIGTLHCRMGGPDSKPSFFDVPVKVLEMTSTDDATRESYALSWQGQMLPRWFGMAERVQTVERVGEAECVLRQWESMSGWGVRILNWVMGIEAQLKEGNLMFAEDLKAWCERESNAGAHA